MGPSPAKPGPEQAPSGSEPGVYYGVYLPPDVNSTEDPESTVVFTDKSEALKLVKKYKKARFKAFPTMSAAIHFAAIGPDNPSSAQVTSPLVGEKPSPFRIPKPQDMVRFRKAIEGGDIEFVKKTVWENPRYLVSSGDTAAILQEGSRYNALHIAAKAGNAAMTAYILQTVGSREFMHHFYGDSVDVDERCQVLLDLYLNMPDKALNETPLHFAAKFGAASVVQVLVTYPQCDRNATNKYDQTPKEVVCTRKARVELGLKEEIAAMLDEQFYVPVLRSPDHSVPPVVGSPFSPNSPLQEHEMSGGEDVTSPRLEVQAYAGPMVRQRAEMFRRRWKTPPRMPGSPLPARRPTLTDQVKGWERVGRELAQEWKVPWREYWPFLNAFTDLSTPEGLQLLEDYLRKRFKNISFSVDSSSEEDNSSLRPTISVTSPESPVSELCSALRACSLVGRGSGEGRPPPRLATFSRHNSHQHNGTHTALTILPESSPHLYMEKSCQVFAKRIVDCLAFSEGDLSFLWEEARHLNTLVDSCLQDNRFAHLDFSRIHSRLANTVVKKSGALDIQNLKTQLHDLVEGKTEDCFSSDEEEEVIDHLKYRKRCYGDHRLHRRLRSTVQCLARAIVSTIEQAEEATAFWDSEQPLLTSEQACASEWARAESCPCTFTHGRLPRPGFIQPRFDDRLKASADSSGEESDTSDTSEGEFFTPPSSPGLRSDDDQAMESPDEGPDVYIVGNTPSKWDVSVMEAIGNCELTKSKYPNICRWRHLVLLHSEQERQSWMSSPKHKTNNCDTPVWKSPHQGNSPVWKFSRQGDSPIWKYPQWSWHD